MAADDATPPAKGNAETHRARKAFIKSCDASRAIIAAAEAVSAEIDDVDTVDGIPIPTNLKDDDSLVISIGNAMNTQRSRRAVRAKTNNGTR